MFESSRLCRSMVAVVVLTSASVVAASAQNSARVFGVITDRGGQPVAGATVTLEFAGGLTRSFEVTTDEAGEFLQIGLARGPYTLTATREGVGINRVGIDLVGGAGAGTEPDAVDGRGDLPGQPVGRGAGGLRRPERHHRRLRAGARGRPRRPARSGGGAPPQRAGGDTGLRRMPAQPGHRLRPDGGLRRGGSGLPGGAGAGPRTMPSPTADWRRSTTRSGGSTTRPRRARRRPGSRAAGGATTPPRSSTRASSSGTPAASTRPGSSSSARCSSTPSTERPTTGSAWRT